eukprot:CAMPEP_0185779798 /NCGR_PEP_ID=MMETSP1174-20130828/96959_1 /TAXON_ID=35687 /ORGANISM="Dictyocha speculum, Strain CCMP1381" /LENGTH=71 /DNA_ID=CAMNT_0028469065 /DNA_START=285 /DNA_END=497 /DNA_ORIENTATION=+
MLSLTLRMPRTEIRALRASPVLPPPCVHVHDSTRATTAGWPGRGEPCTDAHTSSPPRGTSAARMRYRGSNN